MSRKRRGHTVKTEKARIRESFKITTTLDSHRKLPLLNSYKTSNSFNLAFAKTCAKRVENNNSR